MAESIADSAVLSKLWDDKKNGAAASVLVRSFRPAWWRCESGHSFQRSPRSMLSDSACPDCRRGPSTSSIAKARPSIVPLWNSEKNGDLSPSTVDAAQVGSAWWRCPKAHDFQRSPLLMVRDSSCPVCTASEKSLATINPAVASEWHPKKNGEITAAQVEADHVMNAWWLCPNGHDYQATVRSRARGSRNCPTCYGGWSLENMGANLTDYVREAHRCLRLDGWLHVWEPASYFDDVAKFCAKLSRLGFDVMAPQTEGAFVGIYAVRNAKKPDAKLVLPFRGHGE